MKLYLISRVRQSTPELKAREQALVDTLERAGHAVHWPIRDTRQDVNENGICFCNQMAIASADVVLVAALTEGSVFDLGMAFVYDKPLVGVPGLCPGVTETPSFANLVWWHAEEVHHWQSEQIKDIALSREW